MEAAAAAAFSFPHRCKRESAACAFCAFVLIEEAGRAARGLRVAQEWSSRRRCFRQ